MKRLLIFSLPLFLIACNTQEPIGAESIQVEEKVYADVSMEKDSLYSISENGFEYGSACGYRNAAGDTVFKAGSFESCFTDTFVNFAYVYERAAFGKEMVAINRNKEVVFDAFLFDNAPDEASEGLFRIKRNGKIGYANASGKVVIEAKYSCAYPFENGKAQVALDCTETNEDEHRQWKSNAWFYIDKQGKKVN